MNLASESMLFVSAVALFGVGLFGLIRLRNLIHIVVAVQIMAKAAMMALVAAGISSGRINLGQSLAATVIVADTMVVVVGLALAVQVRKRFGTLDVNELTTLRR